MEVYDEYVELLYGAQSLSLGQPHRLCLDHDDLDGLGRSRGSDLTVAHRGGVVPRDRERGDLPVELRDVLINGRVDQNGDPVTANRRASAKTTLRDLLAFLNDAPGRRMTIRLHEGDDVYEGDSAFLEHGAIRWPDRDVVKVSLLFTVAEGKLTLVEESS